MEWIESHTNLGEHPKVTELAFNLMIRRHEVIGHLHLLWHFTMKYAWRDGDLSRFSAKTICHTIGWENDPNTFINALRETGWLEKDGIVIHDWKHYAGKMVIDRLYKESRRHSPTVADKTRQVVATVPDRTVPESKKRKTKTPATTNVAEREKSPHVEFMDRFKILYEEMTKQPYQFKAHQFIIVQKLIKAHGYEAVVAKVKILGALCKNGSKWFTKDGWADFTIEKLSGHWNSIIPSSTEMPEEKKRREFQEAIKKQEEKDARIDSAINAG